MTLQEAIEILTYRSNPRHKYYDQKELPAIKLGIEAQKRIIRQRSDLEPAERRLLPGETEE